MSDGSNYLDPDRPEAVRLSVGNARALGEAALVRIGYGADDACIITDQLIDNALCGYRFAGCPHPRGRATRRPGTPASQSPPYTNHPSPRSSIRQRFRGADIAIGKAKQTAVRPRQGARPPASRLFDRIPKVEDLFADRLGILETLSD